MKTVVMRAGMGIMKRAVVIETGRNPVFLECGFAVLHSNGTPADRGGAILFVTTTQLYFAYEHIVYCTAKDNRTVKSSGCVMVRPPRSISHD